MTSQTLTLIARASIAMGIALALVRAGHADNAGSRPMVPDAVPPAVAVTCHPGSQEAYQEAQQSDGAASAHAVARAKVDCSASASATVTVQSDGKGRTSVSRSSSSSSSLVHSSARSTTGPD